MTLPDLTPASRRMADLLAGIPDDALAGPTPCSAYTLADLVDHVGGLSLAFTDAATKAVGVGETQAPSPDGSRLEPEWRTRIARDLDVLAEAWRDPEAWTGMTAAGGVELPGEVAGIVALDELVLHGWDVARASGQTYDCDPASLELVHGFLRQAADEGAARAGLFGPVVPVPDDAPLLDQAVGLAGREPGWSPR